MKGVNVEKMDQKDRRTDRRIDRRILLSCLALFLAACLCLSLVSIAGAAFLLYQ
jgi:hypothetical protein